MVRARERVEVDAAAGGDGDGDEASAGMAGHHDSRGRTPRQRVGLAAGRLGGQPHRQRFAGSGFVDDIHVGEHAQGDGGALSADAVFADLTDLDASCRSIVRGWLRQPASITAVAAAMRRWARRSPARLLAIWFIT